MNNDRLPSRRSFLRTALAAPVAGAMVGGYSPAAAEDRTAGGASSIVSRVILDKELYDWDTVVSGQVHFRLPAGGPVVVRWLDSFGRVVGEKELPASKSGVAPQSFDFRLEPGFTYRNWIRVGVNGVEQTAGAHFMLSPAPKPWDDFHVISWAHYPDGFYDLLRQVGVDATIAYKEATDPVLDNNFNFYVEQLMWEVFAIYHKDQPLWRGLLNQISLDRNNLDLWVRKPCVNDPKTDEYVNDHLTRYVRIHRAFRPLFYNIADELGQGDQIRPNDFCHSPFCTIKFAEYLRKMYGHVQALGKEWQAGEPTHFDDESLRNGSEWAKSNLLINYTTTDCAFDQVAVAHLQVKYGGLAGVNKAWGINLPSPRQGTSDDEQWEPLLAMMSETRSFPELTEEALSARLGPIEKANERWGTHSSWGAEQHPAGFQSWAEVVTIVKRYYQELSQVRSTEGWNVSPWCDFRNFMDRTFADAIGRARAVCQAEDPHARCATEGGQSPFPFGWYNYENVVKVVDVIEPYNGGNSDEVIRSLNPNVIMLSTHGYQHKPGAPLTEEDRQYQKRAPQSIWWGLFHQHRGSIIWDANIPEYQFVDRETREITPSATTFAGTFLELRQGIGKLIANSRRLHDGIAIHYSQASMQVHWLLDNVGNARNWPVHSGGDHSSHFIAVRNGWTKTIEDLGLQYEFVGRGQIEEGKLGRGEYRVLILPQSLAASELEVEQIREFVNAGGVLVADYRAATMNEHGRDLGRGRLDDVFGITHVKGQAKGSGASGIEDLDSLRLKGEKLRLLAGDETLSVTSGKALAQSGQVPLIVVNDFGKGKAVYMNVETGHYPYDRLQPNPATSLPNVVEQIFGLAHIEPQVRVLDASGNRLPGTEVVRFANGAFEHVAVFRNPQFDDGGWGDLPTRPEREWAGSIDNSYLEKDAQVTLAWPSALPTYDIRGKRDLGETPKAQLLLDAWSPLVITRAPQAVPPLRVEVTAEVPAGNPLIVHLQSDALLPEGTCRVIRLEFTTPGAEPYDLYARNVKLESAAHQERFDFAYNDPLGQWKLSAHDLVTGRVVQTAFTLRPS
ncbi:MAG: beta-galactosidase trimerization domain-containing protein [Terriglobia bacterium]|jgi:hypothetical protein